MNSQTDIRELTATYLANLRAPDIVGFVDQLFWVAAENGGVRGSLAADKKLRFVLGTKLEPAPNGAESPEIYDVEQESAQTILRMICARLGAICKERVEAEVSPYAGKADFEFEIHGHRQWSVSFTNTPGRQEFMVKAL